MEIIKDFLFGKEVLFSDSKIGNLTTRVKKKNSSKNYTWTGEHLVEGQQRPTVFLLEGNYEQPAKSQLNAVRQILDSLDKIVSQVDVIIKNQPDIKQRYKTDWTKDFYLDTVVLHIPSETKDGDTQFEVSFSSINEKDDYICFLWENGNLTEIEAK